MSYSLNMSMMHALVTWKKSLNILANICWSSRRLQDTSWRCLQDDNFSSSKTSCKTSWRRLGRRKIVTLKTFWGRLEDVLKTCLEDVLKTSLEDVLNTYLEDVCKMSWRQTKCFLKLSVSSKSKCLSNKSGISQIYIWRI